MAEASLKLGGDWGVKEGSLLGFNDQNGNYKPIPFDFTRATTATRVNRDGLIEEVQAGVPRIDFTGDGSLLLEPQRTNLIDQSEYLSVWAATRCVISDNDTTSPDGTINASKMTSNDAAESYIQKNATLSGSIVAYSFYAKKGDLDYVHSLVWDLSANGCRQWFNLANGTIGSSTTFGSGYSVNSASIQDMGNGWYRCITIVNCSSGTNGFRVNISSADSSINSPVNSYGYFWGIQAEDSSSYATSYIKTSGSAVTRNADVCDNTSASSYIGQTEGTLFAKVGKFPKEFNGRIFAISDGSSNNYVTIIRNSTNNDFAVYATTSGVAQATYLGTGSLADNSKIAVGYANNDYVVYVNGTQVHTDTNASVPACSQVFVGHRENGSSTYIAGGSITEAVLYKTRLTNEELAALTTL